ncbi:unnamed protein product [Arctogadus glacialis]
MGRVCPPRGIVFLGTLKKNVLHSGMDALSAHTKHHHPHHHQQLKQIHNHTGNRAPHVQQHLPQETAFSSVSAALLACIHPSPHLPICPLSSLPLSSFFSIPLSFSPSPLHPSLLYPSFPPSLFPFLPLSSILCLLSLLSCSSLPLSSLSPPSPSKYLCVYCVALGWRGTSERGKPNMLPYVCRRTGRARIQFHFNSDGLCCRWGGCGGEGGLNVIPSWE